MQRTLMLALAALVVATGCTNGAGKGLSVSAAVSSAAADTNTVASGNVIDAGNGILITRIRVVVARAEVEGPPACANVIAPSSTPLVPGLAGASPVRSPAFDGRDGPSACFGSERHGSGSGEGDCDCECDDDDPCEIEDGPFLVDLSGEDLAGGVHLVGGLEVPAGTYDKVEFKINTICARRAGSDAGLQDMAAAHASILVDGTMDGAPYRFSTPMALEQERQGPIVVDDTSGGNVTLDFDASGWFQAADGSKLDPADPTARGAILANIRASIRVLSDRDCDGWDDDDGERPPYDPCAWKACGAWCRACPPWDEHCAETAVLKVCDPTGACVIQGTPFICPGLPDPCAGLACGSGCVISLPCHLATPPCEAPQRLGHCDLSGQCLPGDATSCEPSADCAGKACGASCNPCGPDQVCPTFMATACDPWGRCISALPGLCACDGKACGETCDPCDGLCSHPYASTCDGTSHCRPVGHGVTCGP
jgi:hypothetical protein